MQNERNILHVGSLVVDRHRHIDDLPIGKDDLRISATGDQAGGSVTRQKRSTQEAESKHSGSAQSCPPRAKET
jgi:hypothetical protein